MSAPLPMRRMTGAAFATAAVLLAGCAALHAPPPPSAELRTTAPVVATDIATDGHWPQAQWWKSYGDATLDALVELAIGDGPTIAGADARIRAAEQEVQVASAALGVSVDARGSITRQRLSDNGMIPPQFLGFHWYDQSDLGIAVKYQFDWWGKQRATMDGALDRARATAAQRQAAELALAAAVSQAYFAWQADSARVGLLEQSVAARERLLGIAQSRQAAELDSADATLEAGRELSGERERLAAARGAVHLDVVDLAGLLGIEPGKLPALMVRPLPRVNAALPDDAGTNLLARRPDIQASRWRVEAALRDSDVTRASYYPDVSLHALAGLSSVDIGKLLETGSRTPQFGIAVDLPLFDAGLRQARHGAALAELDIAIATYDDAVVNAARETGRAAAALSQANAQLAEREQQLSATRALVSAADARLAGEMTHAGPALAAHVEELQQQNQLVSLALAAVLADVQLKQALAGNPAPTEDTP